MILDLGFAKLGCENVYFVGNTEVGTTLPLLLCPDLLWLEQCGWVVEQFLGSPLVHELAVGSAFAPTVGRSGFAIMMFNCFQKNRGKKEAGFV